jgi:hypothetical protein
MTYVLVSCIAIEVVPRYPIFIGSARGEGGIAAGDEL